MIKLILPLLITPILEAKISAPRQVEGKLVQVTYSEETACGSEYIAIVETKTAFKFIYLYDIKMANKLIKYANKRVYIVYTEAIGIVKECGVKVMSVEGGVI